MDHLLRTRVSSHAARLFLAAIAEGEHTVAYATPELLRRAVGLDAHYRDLGLGLCDGLVMACAERREAPILTFDFAHFRATRPARGHWRLIVDEARYRESVEP